MLGRFAVYYQGQKLKIREILQIFDDVGYHVPERTLKGYMAKIKSSTPITSRVKKSGRPAVTSGENELGFVGWILSEFHAHKEVRMKDCVAFFVTHYGLSISESTIRRIMVKYGVVQEGADAHSRNQCSDRWPRQYGAFVDQKSACIEEL